MSLGHVLSGGAEMGCCKAEEFKWCQDLPVVDFKDDKGNEYCIFHAPQGKKGVSLEDFNKLVFERIEDFKELPDDEREGKVCDLSGTVFEESINFKRFEFPNIYFRNATLQEVNFSEATFLEADFRKATFTKINFSHTKFHETTFRQSMFTEADFDNAVFLGKTNFSKSVFLGKSKFSKIVFSGKVSFNRVKFSGETQFKNTTFSEEVYFSSVSFLERVSFGGTMFSEKVSFGNASFLERVSFGNATFSERVHFSSTKFSEKVNFRRTTFLGKTHFNDTIFEKKMSLRGATFNEEAFFSNAIFEGEANLNSILFEKKAYFGKSTFLNLADFRKTSFSGEANFSKSSFLKETLFNNVIFSSDARFRGAIFSGDTQFKKVMFSGETQFSEAKFVSNTFFGNAIFSGRTDFNRAEINNANFTHTTFRGVSVFGETSFKTVSFFRATMHKIIYFETNFIQWADFSRVVVEDKIKFQNVDASRVSFLESDIRVFDFVNCMWDKKGERYRLYDEVKLFREDNPSKDDIRKVESLYRAQKDKSGKDHNQFDYSLWHMGEKDMQKERTFFRETPCLWAILRIYNCCSGYGEAPKRAAGMLIGLIILSFLVFGFIGFEPVNKDNSSKEDVFRLVRPITEINDYNPFPHWYAKEKDVETVAITTLEYLTFFKSVDMRPHGFGGRFALIVFRILIPIQAALFGMALRNRLRR